MTAPTGRPLPLGVPRRIMATHATVALDEELREALDASVRQRDRTQAAQTPPAESTQQASPSPSPATKPATKPRKRASTKQTSTTKAAKPAPPQPAKPARRVAGLADLNPAETATWMRF